MMRSWLVSYHSTRDGWTTAVVEAADRDRAVAYAVNRFGPANDAARINVQQLSGLPLVRYTGRRLTVDTVGALVA